MRLTFPKVTFLGLASGVLDANAVSDPIRVDNEQMIAIQAVLTGTTPAGTLKVQASCDIGQDQGSGPSGIKLVTNWSDVAGVTKTFTDVGDALFVITDAPYPWVRLVWTSTSGTGAITAKASAKGAS